MSCGSHVIAELVAPSLDLRVFGSDALKLSCAR